MARAKITPEVQSTAWVQSRRRFLTKIQSEVAQRLGDEPADIRLARKKLGRELQRPFVKSSKAELLGAIELADIVFGGDFHAYSQAQRTHLRILRSIGSDRPIVLALEAFSVRSQKWIDLYLAGAIAGDDLRKKSHWDREWGFPWAHYQPLLELARSARMRIVALRDHRRVMTGLKDQDRFAAEQVANIYKKNPGCLIYTVYGDLHLHATGLPFQVAQLLSKSRKSQLRSLVIHLNPERAYFSLARKGEELAVDVVKFSPTAFGVLSSPPWVPWQNYLLFLDYLEGKADDFDEDLDRSHPEPDEFHLAAPEATDHVLRFAELLLEDFEAEIPLDSFSVHPTGDATIAVQASRMLSKKKLQIAKHLLASGRSFVLAENQTAHLASAAVNHAAHVAGLFVHLGLSGYKKTPWDFPDDFEKAIWCEAVAFCLSKYINHKRRALTLNDLRSQLMMYAKDEEFGKEALKLALDTRMSEVLMIHEGRSRPVRFRPRQKSSYIEAARILGSMMGERLFLAMRTGKMKKSELKRLMQKPVDDEFADLYHEVVMRLGSRLDQKFKSKRERI